jgi:hypothetical protein
VSGKLKRTARNWPALPLEGRALKRSIAEWLWRAALLGALAWIGWELMLLHNDLQQSPGDQATVSSADDDTLDSLDAIRDDLADLTEKVDAIMVAMTRAK